MRPMDLHPVLNRIFDYEHGGIEELLREYKVGDLNRIWSTDLPSTVKQQFIETHQGNKMPQVIKLLANKSTLKMCDQCLMEESNDKKRSEDVKYLCA